MSLYPAAGRALACLSPILFLATIGCGPPAPPAGTPSQVGPVAEQQGTDQQPVETPAGVGSGAKGHSYGGGPISEPAAAYWRTKEKIAFEIQIPQALEINKALDPDGKGPASHEEFMEEIIRANRIELPELPEGMQYRYDPEKGQLMVVSE